MTLKNGISEKQPELAKYILVVMILGIASKLKFPFAPHLLKTYNLQVLILWKRAKSFGNEEDILCSACPKLTKAHVDFTLFSCMKVYLAAQVMSETVANALQHCYVVHVSERV